MKIAKKCFLKVLIQGRTRTFLVEFFMFWRKKTRHFFFIYKFSDTLTSRSRFLQPWIWSICFCLPGLQKPKVNLSWANEPLMPEVNCSCANAESEPFMCICRKWTFHDTRLLFLIRSQIRIQGDIQGAFIQRAIYVHTHTQAGISPRKSSLRVCIYRCIEKTILADRKISETEEDNRVVVLAVFIGKERLNVTR